MKLVEEALGEVRGRGVWYATAALLGVVLLDYMLELMVRGVKP